MNFDPARFRRFAATLLTFATVVASPQGATAGGPISLDVRELDIYDTVRLLSTQAAINVVVDSSVPHRNVTLRLHDVTFAQALATLAQSNDLQSVRVGNIIYLGPSETMNRRYPTDGSGGLRAVAFTIKNGAPDDIARSLVDAVPRGTLVVPDKRTSTILVTGSPTAIARARDTIAAFDRTSSLQHAAIAMHFVKASDALKALTATLPIGASQSAYAADTQNALILTGSADFLAQAGAIVAHIDRPGQQVRYDVRVTDLQPSTSSNVGFLFSGGDSTTTGVATTSFVRNSLALNVTLNALVARGEAKVLARPTLSSLNNVPASLLVGQQYPIVYFDARTGTNQVQFVNVGVNLNVTPTIGSDGAITTDLEADYSAASNGPRDFPIISTRRAQSTLRVRDGETIVIAGLFSDVDSTTLTKVPFLADIPLLGEIFKNRTRDHRRDEVVFLITPHLVSDDGTDKAALPAGTTPVP